MGLSHETITVGSFYTVNHCAKYSRTAAARGFLETVPPQGFASPEFLHCSFAELNSKRSIAGCSSSDVATDKMWHYFPFVSHTSVLRWENGENPQEKHVVVFTCKNMSLWCCKDVRKHTAHPKKRLSLIFSVNVCTRTHCVNVRRQVCFHSVGSGPWAQVVRLNGSHLTHPHFIFSVLYFVDCLRK